jgi:hypothetical protein
MKTVLASSDIFEASSKLQAAASILERLSRGDHLRAEDRDYLRWCGNFLEEVDWKAPAEASPEGATHLSVRATEIRPSFYATLRNTQQLFRDAGIQEEQVREFLSSTYQFLRSTAEGKEQSFEHIDLATAFLKRLSAELLLRLTRNGVPAERDRAMSALG